jgi:hypothetical protein
MDKAIGIYNKVLSNDLCDQLIFTFNTFEKLNLTRTRLEHEGTHSFEKDDTSVFLPGDDLNLEHTSDDLYQKFNDVFWNICYKNYAEKYSILNTFDKHTVYNIKIQKTKPGQGYHAWHAESIDRSSSSRLLSWTGYLNDNFEAGETEFLYQQYRYKPNKGDLVIFPASFTHTHRGNPPIGGDKYIITGWVEF